MVESAREFIYLSLVCGLVLTVGSALAEAKTDAIFQILGSASQEAGPAINGEAAAQISVVMFLLCAFILFVVVPGRLGLFRMLS